MIGRLEASGRALARVLAASGLGVLLLFAATTIVDGLLRFFAAHPIDAVRDLGGLVAAFAVAACIPLAVIERSNITIRFVTSFIDRRAGRAADIAAALLVEVVLILMAWQFALYAARAAADGSATWMLRLPTAPLWWWVAAMLAISAMLQVIVLLLCVAGVSPASAEPAI